MIVDQEGSKGDRKEKAGPGEYVGYDAQVRQHSE
jgi:hypothetical protein